MSDDIKQNQLFEVQRIMRKQLAAWSNPKQLTTSENAAVNKIIHSSEAARDSEVTAVLNNVDLGDALQGSTRSGDRAEKLFIAAVIQVCHKVGITIKKDGWPLSLDGETIPSLSEKVLP